MLDKYHYDLIKVYCVSNEINFIQVKSPLHRKIFFIYIPQRYIIRNENDEIENISPSEENQHQIKYLSMFEDINIVCISSSSLCHSMNSKCDFYRFGENDTVEEDDVVARLENELKHAKEKIYTADVNFVEQTPTAIEPIELVFEDVDGNEIEQGSKMDRIIAHSEKKINIGKTKVASLKQESPISDVESEDEHVPESDDTTFNDVPENLDQEEINVGMIYVCIDINDFFYKISTYETVLLNCYNDIEEKEYDVREIKIRKIEDLVINFKVNSFDKIEDIKNQEVDIKTQIKRLSSILLSCENLERRKKHDDASDIETIVKETKRTIDDFHIELLRLRDKAHYVLDEYTNYVQGLLKI